ncbi:MAG: DUF2075 domain-containing protein [Verrucomicrobia bacterium]|nr:DUF2075 domain-containing protein [Verrucomicrobiota bacterium]
MSAGAAWYVKVREVFVRDTVQSVVGELASNAMREGLHVEPEQHEEWRSSVGVLQKELRDRAGEIALLKETLAADDLEAYRHVLLEFDFRRRGLRMDCVLLGDGVIVVVEFKRTKLTVADREQVTNYAVNLVEFHEETRRLILDERVIVAPVLALTSEARVGVKAGCGFLGAPWDGVLARPVECDGANLHAALLFVLQQRRARGAIDCSRWLFARFAPSSSILDPAISLYGQHDVSAISDHAAPVELIERCTREVAGLARRSFNEETNRIIFVSGAPGAGKTLVGLKLAFDQDLRQETVFVTGNAPLVEVLGAALKGAYKRRTRQAAGVVAASGYAREQAARVIGMSTFKLVKAHAFLGERGRHLGTSDGRMVIFDEAQRTYRKGRLVLRKPLAADEARLILESMRGTHPNGAVVVALIGHNQAINSGEMGIEAWFKAAVECRWRFAISDETLALGEVMASGRWDSHPLRERLETGHLPHSMRYYRNGGLEQWADHVLGERAEAAARLAMELDERGDTVWITRSLTAARRWVRGRRVGQERAGIIASGQARRLAAEGLFVDLKPKIADWMLAPGGDVRSANMLETVQNQYQVQGLELDYTLVGWDGDLRRGPKGWSAWKMSGGGWQRDKELGIAKNGYRVLLTRARKGMVIFVPCGDASGEDATRPPDMYDAIADHLMRCGARALAED